MCVRRYQRRGVEQTALPSTVVEDPGLAWRKRLVKKVGNSELGKRERETERETESAPAVRLCFVYVVYFVTRSKPTPLSSPGAIDPPARMWWCCCRTFEPWCSLIKNLKKAPTISPCLRSSVSPPWCSLLLQNTEAAAAASSSSPQQERAGRVDDTDGERMERERERVDSRGFENTRYGSSWSSLEQSTHESSRWDTRVGKSRRPLDIAAKTRVSAIPKSSCRLSSPLLCRCFISS